MPRGSPIHSGTTRHKQRLSTEALVREVPTAGTSTLDSQVGGWLINVNGVIRDATAAVSTHNQFNPAPQAGHKFFIANVSATYQGEKNSSMLLGDVTPKAVDESAVSATTLRTATVHGTGSCLNLRSEPSTSAVPLTCLADGTEVVLGAGNRVYQDDRWWRLVESGGMAGWLAEEFLLLP
jgi:hypothetical protein